MIAQTKEDKILRLESLMDGVLPPEEFLEEEFASLKHEHRVCFLHLKAVTFLCKNVTSFSSIAKYELICKNLSLSLYKSSLEKEINFYKSSYCGTRISYVYSPIPLFDKFTCKT